MIDLKNSPYYLDAEQETAISAIALRVTSMRTAGSITPAVLKTIRQFFRIRNIYESNAIEGNTLDIGETQLVVQEGMTIAGKSLKDQAEAKNLAEAIDFLEELAADHSRPLSAADIRLLHSLVLKDINEAGAGVYRTKAVVISGSEYSTTSPEQIDADMMRFNDWLLAVTAAPSTVTIAEAILNAIIGHTWFVTIHPFIDGNGRVARLLLNLLLTRYGVPIAIITRNDRKRYYEALERSQVGDLSAVVALVIDSLDETLTQYENAIAANVRIETWTALLASKASPSPTSKDQVEFEIFRSAMDLFKRFFSQTIEILDEKLVGGRAYLKDFGELDFDKYWALKHRAAVKQTWYFRIDFRIGDDAARYLFFFNSASANMRSRSAVSLALARETAPYHFTRLDEISGPAVPDLREVGYHAPAEMFVYRNSGGQIHESRSDDIGQRLVEQIMQFHF